MLGRWLGVPGFDTIQNLEEQEKHVKAMNAATRHDRKARMEEGHDDMVLRGTVVGNAQPLIDMDFHYPKVMKEFVASMRQKYKDHIIRRGIHSTDNEGRPISGLDPYEEHVLLLEMYDWERQNLASIAGELVKDHGAASVYGAGKVILFLPPKIFNLMPFFQNFYLDVRRALLNPWSTEGHHTKSWQKLRSVDELRQENLLTVKLDVLAKVVNYHLQSDGRQPLKNTPDGRDVESDPPAGQGLFNTIPEAPDKIVVFSGFPSSNQLILDVSQAMLCCPIIRMNTVVTGA